MSDHENHTSTSEDLIEITKEKLEQTHLGEAEDTHTHMHPTDNSEESSHSADPTPNDSQEEEDGDTEERSDNTDTTPSPTTSTLAAEHPLQHEWALWYDNPGKRTSTASWGDHLKKIVTFSTVEEFWRVFNNIKPASALQPGSNYHLFKEPVQPKWEDEANQKGGKWVVGIPPKSNSRGSQNPTDQFWLWTVLACIGEGFDYGDEVTGVVVSLRRAQDRLALWTRDATNEPVTRSIGRNLKGVLELPDSVLIGYAVHSDALKTKSPKDRYTL